MILKQVKQKAQTKKCHDNLGTRLWEKGPKAFM